MEKMDGVGLDAHDDSVTMEFLDGNSKETGSSLSVDKEAKLNSERGTWGRKIEFFLAIMGYTVGVGSIWRFPITCSRNGGGAFLIPFFFFLITAGGPLYYMEVCIGQFCGKSACHAFKFCPLLQGIGFLQVCLSITVLWYSLMVYSWSIYYLYESFSQTLPWTTCTNPWNTNKCEDFVGTVSTVLTNATQVFNDTSSRNGSYEVNGEFATQSAAFEFWEYRVIGRSKGLHDLGQVQIHLYIGVIIAMTSIVLAVIKGPTTLGKVVYVTATAPFILLTVMFIKCLTLEGSLDGIVMFLKPDFAKLLEVQVWLEAAIQVFFSLGPSWGGVITMASYNKFNQQSFRATTMCVASCGFSSFYNGMIVFSILGFMAKETGLPIQEVASKSGPGLTFVAFPAALSKMPLPQVWSVLFFLTLITVIFDSQFGGFEAFTCGIIDLFPKQLMRRRAIVNIAIGLLCVITQIPLCLNGGIYIFQLCDWYFSQFALLFGSLFECIAVCWIYGTDRFSQDIQLMTGRNVSTLLRCLWTVIIPLFAFVSLLTMLSNYSTPAYGDGYVYSTWAITIGIACGLLPIAGMVIIGIGTLILQNGPIVQRLGKSLKPSKDWCPNDDKAREQYTFNAYEYPTSRKERIILDLCGRKRL